jgi:succinoglycan biosynthesis protein ExoO
MRPSAPRVTVMTPAYNAAHCLPRAVQSVLAQSERDFEYIIVDDGSEDDTRAAARELARSDNRIRTIFMPCNGGASSALNAATDVARGRWVALLDADDWYEPTRLQRLLDAAERADVQMVADNQVIFDAKADRRVGLAFPNGGGARRIGLAEFIAATDPTASFDIGMLKPIFRTDFIRSRRVTYREDVRHGYDYFVLLDFFVTGGHALLVPDPLYWYVQPFGTLSRQWAQDGGRRYPFEHVKRMNDDVIADMSGRLSLEHLESLIRRGYALEALACLHQVREQLQAANLWQACRLVANAPTGFWRLCLRRAARRVAQSPTADFARRRSRWREPLCTKIAKNKRRIV